MILSFLDIEPACRQAGPTPFKRRAHLIKIEGQIKSILDLQANHREETITKQAVLEKP